MSLLRHVVGCAPLVDSLRYGFFEYIQLGRGRVADQGVLDVHSSICRDNEFCGKSLFLFEGL